MLKKIKIAIPTDDGVTVARRFGGSRSFLVITAGTAGTTGILARETRWNLLSEILTSDLGSHYNLSDCNTVIVNEIGNCHCRRLEAEKKQIFRTGNKLIEEAVSAYLRSQRILETVEV